ncbi:MAG: choice-of-anchor B family protein [Gammaproteobacteria bacterium]|nr:choice-of-anchor B family protein [Gammaproteobacteria bacterium]
MTNKQVGRRRFLDGEFHRTVHLFVWAPALALLVAMLPFAAHADDPETIPTHRASLGHPKTSDLEGKRLKNTGKGMPSVEGPFPDTVNMEFLGQLTNEELGVSKLVFTGASFLSDIWGWTSKDPKTGDIINEYAIVGTSSGVAFVRITDPVNPEFLGRVPTTDTTTIRNFWWDIKTYKNHAYWTTEVNNAGVAIFELTQLDDLPQAPPDTTLEADARYTADGYIRAHNISINEDTGFAYLTGVSKDPAVDPGFTDDGTIILDLKGDPLAPVEVGQILNIDSHDAQVVTYAGDDADPNGMSYQGKEIAFIFNGGDLEVGIYDVTKKSNIREISVTTYAGASFTHQGWLTEDHGFLLMGDEEDELFGLSDPRNPDLPDTARTYIWDVRDLDNPVVIGTFDSPAASIDHNLFVKGDRVYQAHYTAGIRVLNSSGVANGILSEVAHMDTEPRLPNNHMNKNINIFVGPWGVFPFFESGTIIASDGLNGLIISRLVQ